MKKIVIILIAIAVLLLTTAIVLPWLLSGKIVEVIKAEANKQLNARIEFQSVGASLFRNFPELTVSMHQLEIQGIGRFDNHPLLKVKRLDVSLTIWNAFKGSPFEIQRVILESADIQLLVLEDGTVNWDIIPTESETETIPEAEGDAVQLKLQRLTVKNSRLLYEDRELVFFTELNGVNGSMSGDLSSEQSRLGLELKAEQLDVAYENIPILSKVATVFNGTIDANFTESIYAVKSEQLFLNALSVIFGGVFHLKEEAIGIQLSFNAPDGDFKQLLSLVPAVYANQFEKLKAKGSFSLGGYMNGDYSETSFPSFGMSMTIGEGAFSYPEMPASMEKISMAMKLDNPSGDFDDTRINLDHFSFEVAQNPFFLSLSVRSPVSDPHIETFMSGKINLADIRELLPKGTMPDMTGIMEADFKLKTKKSALDKRQYKDVVAEGQLLASNVNVPYKDFADPLRIGRGRIALNPSFAQADFTALHIGRSDLSFEGKLEDYLPYYLTQGELVAKLKVSSELLDINEILGMLPTDSTEKDKSAEEQNLQLPKRIRAAFAANVKNMIFMQYELSDVEAVIDYRDQQIVFQPLKADMMGGTVELKGSYDGNNMQVAPIDIDFNLRGFDIPTAYQTIGLFQAAAPVAGKTKGRFSTNFRLKGMLDGTMNPIYESLQGGGGLQSTQITVESVNAMHTIATLLGNESYKRIVTDGLNLSFEFLNGRVFQKPFGFKYGEGDVTISGSLGFDKQLDYDMVFQLPFSALGSQVADGIKNLASRAAGGIALQPGTSVQVKARITGMVNDPKISIDYKDFASNIKSDITKTALQEIDKQKEQLRKQAKAEADRLIAEARERAGAIIDEANQAANRLRSEAAQAALKLRTEADNQAEKLIAEGKARGLIAERAAMEAARKLRQQAEQSARTIEQEADLRASKIEDEAKTQADKIVAEAERKAATL